MSAPLLNGQAFTSASTNLSGGQTARLSVVNNGRATESETLTISNSAGALLATQTFSLAPGAAARLDYVATADVGDVYGAIIPCFFCADLQIIVAKKPLVLLEKFLPLPVAPSTFTSPSVGLLNGQTARLSIVNNGRSTETETLTISNSAGAPLATQTFSLAPGAAARLDYVATSNVGDIYAAGNPCDFPADLQIIDNRTQRTLGVVESFLPPPLPNGSVIR